MQSSAHEQDFSRLAFEFNSIMVDIGSACRVSTTYSQFACWAHERKATFLERLSVQVEALKLELGYKSLSIEDEIAYQNFLASQSSPETSQDSGSHLPLKATSLISDLKRLRAGIVAKPS